jgi:hypothetical protein
MAYAYAGFFRAASSIPDCLQQCRVVLRVYMFKKLKISVTPRRFFSLAKMSFSPNKGAPG